MLGWQLELCWNYRIRFIRNKFSVPAASSYIVCTLLGCVESLVKAERVLPAFSCRWSHRTLQNQYPSISRQNSHERCDKSFAAANQKQNPHTKASWWMPYLWLILLILANNWINLNYIKILVKIREILGERNEEECSVLVMCFIIWQMNGIPTPK